MGSRGKRLSKRPSRSKKKGAKKNNPRGKCSASSATTPENIPKSQSDAKKCTAKRPNCLGDEEPLIVTAPSQSGAHEKTLSNGTQHARKRSYSVTAGIGSASDNTGEEHSTSSEAITLLGVQARRRLSEPDRPLLEITQLRSNQNSLSSEKPPDSMALEKASLMDFVTEKKPKKKNRISKKKKSGDTSTEDSTPAAAEEQRRLSGERSKTGDGTISLPYRLKQDTMKPETGEQAELGAAGNAVSCDVTEYKGKGKQRASVSESEPSNKDGALPSTQPLLANKKSDTCQAVIEAPRTPELGGVKGSKSFTPSPSLQTSGRSTVSMKEKLPFIKEGQVQREAQPIFEESPSLRTATPKSTGTASTSTGWTIATTPGARLSPQTTAASDSPTAHHAKQGSTSLSRLTIPFNPQVQITNTHAHPSPSKSNSTDIIIQQPTAQGLRTITTQKPDGFFYQLDSHGFLCASPTCDKRCNLWDGASVICPRCGPYSETRYCSLDHLSEDLKLHWVNCGQSVFKHPCRESSIPKSVRDGLPLIPCLHRYDTPERHRQAVHFNMNARRGDYFIFSDWADMVDSGFPDDNLALRCSNRVVHVVEFTDPEEKDRFRRVLAACLFLTLEAHDLVDYLFRLIRTNILRTNTNPRNNQTQTQTLETLETALKHQVYNEFATIIQPSITGARHACPTDWTGANRRTCTDAVCRSEYRRLLGQLGGRGGFQALLQNLEGSYWILRVARTTHPDVRGAGARMRGEGFGEEVAVEDRRGFFRGLGWDGVGVGGGKGEMKMEMKMEMEIEGINA